MNRLPRRSRFTTVRLPSLTPVNPSPSLVGAPYDAGSSFLRGAAAAPAAIRTALRSPAGNLWTEDGRDLGQPGALLDAGDLALPESGDAHRAIEEGLAQVLAAGSYPITLGGDHSITWPVLRAIHGANGPVTIVQVDAHPDLYDEFETDRGSHACPFARIMEEGLASRLVQVGIRTMTGPQRQQADRFGVEVIDMRMWGEGARPLVEGLAYLSLDLDGIDPAHAPGVSHREPGGLTVREVVSLIQELGGTLIGADIVEYNPARDVGDLTALVAAKLVKEVAARMRRNSAARPGR